MQYMALGMGIIVLSHITEYISRNSFTKMATKSTEQIRNKLMAAQMHKTMKEYLEENTGDMLSVLTNDMRMIYGIMKNLLKLGCAVVVITHDIFGEYMSDFDRIYYLEEGGIKEQGDLETLLKQQGGFYELYQKMNTVIQIG